MDRILLSRKFYKGLNVNNPISSNIFCADPTSIEFEGRLYVYGTNDQQQYECVGELGKNTYNEIKSIVCFSTSDMCNWVYEGVIDVEKIAPWIDAAWAPSICSRVEKDGLTHFYLYFSNSGNGVGVLTATSPLGPWSSPLDGPVVHRGIAGVEDVPHPFDPGVVLDDNGDGYLAFGGGVIGDDFLPGTVRIIKLGRDLISVEGSAVEIKAPYFFEASELNFINGWYVYTFNSNWIERKIWPYEAEKSSQCSMNYMITKTPLVTDSWQYVGNYFKNPGDQGLNYSNNHTHLGQFKGQWYLFYHALTLQENMPTNGGFRSICVDKIEVKADDCGVQIEMCKGTRQGVPAVGFVDPRSWVDGRLMCTSAEISLPNVQSPRAGAAGSWFLVKNVNFGDAPAATKLQIQLEYGPTADKLPGAFPAEQLADKLPGALPAEQLADKLPGALPAGQLADKLPGALPAGQFADKLPGALPAGQLADKLPGALPAGQLADKLPGALPAGQLADKLPGVLPQDQLSGELPLIQVRLDKLSSDGICSVSVGEDGECALEGVSGVHDVYFVFLQPGVRLLKWKVQ